MMPVTVQSYTEAKAIARAAAQDVGDRLSPPVNGQRIWHAEAFDSAVDTFNEIMAGLGYPEPSYGS